MLLSSFCHHFQTLPDPFLPAYMRNDCQERQESREAQNALFQRLVCPANGVNLKPIWFALVPLNDMESM